MRLRTIAAGVVLGSLASPAYALDDAGKKALVSDFCSALAAQAVCDEISMRFDTRDRVRELVGEDFEDRVSNYWPICSDALSSWPHGNEATACPRFHAEFGCTGIKRPGLVQDALADDDGQHCKFQSP